MALGLLGMPQQFRHEYSSYKYFNHPARWSDLMDLFMKEAAILFHIEFTPMLQNAI